MQQILTHIATFSEQLKNILHKEFETLNQQNFDQLMSLTSKKQSLLAELEAFEQQRLQLSSAYASFNDYLLQQADSKELLKQWEMIRQQLKDCREQNEINGRLLQKKQQLSSEMLGLLSGNQQDNSPATYEADGTQQKPASILGNTQA